MSGISTNRTNINPPAEVAQEILQKAQGASAVMRLARQMPLPGRGAQISVITSDPSAAWVSETAEKPVSNPGLSTKTMTAYKLAVIAPFSREFLRDLRALYNALIARLPGALAQKFDQTVVGAVEAPGENFDSLGSCTSQSLVAAGSHTAYKGLVAAYGDIADHNGSLNGFALSPSAFGLLLGAVDSSGRPIFLPSANDGDINRVLGRQAIEARGCYKSGTSGTSGTPAVVGIAGDWTQALYGLVNGVELSYTEEASLTIASEQVNLWQRNMVAVRAEIEVGFRADTACFNLLTGATPS